MTKLHDRNKKGTKNKNRIKRKTRKGKMENGKFHMTKEILDNKNTSKHRTETNTARRTVTPTNTHQTLKPASISSAHPHSTTTKKPAACRHPERLKREEKD